MTKANESVTLNVSDVDPASTPQGEKKLLASYTNLFSNAALNMFAGFGNETAEAPGKPAVEACSDPEALVVEPSGYHPLVAAVHTAFADHHPLVLTPDAIWITIVQGLATHINLNAEKYRGFFVSHEGKKTLEVRRDTFKLGSPDNNWTDVFGEFSAKIKDHIGADNHSLIVADFSTTGIVERAASEVALMDAMKSYFEYLLSTMCGIPSVTLEGSLSDWEKLHSKVKALYKYPDLEWWLDKVSVFTENCVAAYKGEVDLAFWQSLYKQNDDSGGPYANGWVVKLFPYIKSWETKQTTQKNPLLVYDSQDIDQGGIGHDNLPSALCAVPFIWNYLGTEHNYEFLAGTVGVEQDPQTFALRPKVGWAVRPKPEADPDSDVFSMEPELQ